MSMPISGEIDRFPIPSFNLECPNVLSKCGKKRATPVQEAHVILDHPQSAVNT